MFRSRRTTCVLTAAMLAGLVITTAPAAHAADKVIVFYTQCDKLSATDTVKVKRIDEDGQNPVVIGDTGIVDCPGNTDPTSDKFLSGFAVYGAYGYFSWEKSDGSQTGIGRIKLDGTSAAEPGFVTMPAAVKTIQMSPRAVDGNLYFYADDGRGVGNIATNPRVMKASTSTGTASNVYAPQDASYMSFGVGKDALYVSTDVSLHKALEKVKFDGTQDGVAFSFAVADNDMQFINGVGANLVAESDDTFFLYSMLVSGDGGMGISTAGVTTPNATFSRFKAVPGAIPLPPANFQVWGGNYLYFKDSTGLKISRTDKNGNVTADPFPSTVTTGWMHHISPALASTVTVTTTTTTTAAATTTTTVAATTTTVAATTTTSTAATTTTVAATTTTVAKAAPPTITAGGKTAKSLATFLGLSTPTGAKVSAIVAAGSRAYCKVSGSKVVAIKSGKCKVTVTVTPKKGAKKSKSTTLTVKK